MRFAEATRRINCERIALRATFALYVNGQKLLAAQDSDFKMGQVGFAISTPSKSNGFEVRFDNYVVREAAP